MRKYEILTDDELKKINELNKYIPSIRKLFCVWKDNRTVYSEIADEIKKLLKMIIILKNHNLLMNSLITTIKRLF
jgi:hypothetical protein